MDDDARVAEARNTLGQREGALLSAEMAKLTDRQRTVVTLIARGFTLQQIAERLGAPGRPLSVNTINNHRRAALSALGYRSNVGLTHWAIRESLVSLMDIPGEEEQN